MKNRSITILAVTILIIGVISFLFIKPVVSSILSDWRSLEKAKQDLKDVEDKKRAIEDLKKNTNLSNISSIAQKYIPVDSESGSLVIELTAMAGQNNLKVEQTSMEQPKSTEKASSADSTETQSKTPTPAASTSNQAKYKEVQFSITLNGTYSDFMNFLRAVDSSSRLISLKLLNLIQEPPKEGTTTPAFKADLTGVAFYKPEVSIEKNLENLKISNETTQKFLNLKSYGLQINLPTESGFGRSNPFDGF